MPLTEFEIERIRIAMDSLLQKRRPPEKIRNKLDLGYRIENQSVVVFEIRELWRSPGKKIEEMVAKATYIKSKNEWRVYWQRADLKWHRYDPVSEVSGIEEFCKLVDEDKFCCFWG